MLVVHRGAWASRPMVVPLYLLDDSTVDETSAVVRGTNLDSHLCSPEWDCHEYVNRLALSNQYECHDKKQSRNAINLHHWTSIDEGMSISRNKKPLAEHVLNQRHLLHRRVLEYLVYVLIDDTWYNSEGGKSDDRKGQHFSFVDDSSTSPEELRIEATKLANQRSSFYTKASEIYRAGSCGPAAAAYYSEQGHALDSTIRALNRKAAAMTLWKMNTSKLLFGEGNDFQTAEDNRNKISIDFHGLRVDEGQLLTAALLRFWYDSFYSRQSMVDSKGAFATLKNPSTTTSEIQRVIFETIPKKDIPKLVIVTGSGRHSEVKSRLFPAVLSVLRQKRPFAWMWSTCRNGAAVVIYDVHPIN